MAVTITQGITGIYPVYNDSYIKFTSALSSPLYAEISVPQYTNVFKVYPDLTGEFVFNLKDIVKVVLNADGFNDPIVPNPVNGESIAGTYTTQEFDITVYNASTSETLAGTTYEFYKAVKQVGEEVFANEAQVLNHSLNGVDYYLTYFEGYPFSFDLLRIPAAGSLVVTNLNSAVVATALIAGSTNSFRFYVDKGTENWTTTEFLPLFDIENKLEIKLDTVFKTNVTLKKVDARCGIYVKWFNNQGGYSFWLFDEFYKTQVRSRNLSEISTNSFNNVGSLIAPTVLSGLEGSETLVVKTRVDNKEADILKGLFTSPSVQIWSAREAWQEGEWVNVQVNGNFSVGNKGNLSELSCTIELPNLITAIL